LGRQDSNLCISESEFAQTLSLGGGIRTSASGNQIRCTRFAKARILRRSLVTRDFCQQGAQPDHFQMEMQTYADGSVIEMATIGREGCTGMQAFFGAKTSSVRLLAFMDDVAQTLDKCDVHL